MMVSGFAILGGRVRSDLSEEETLELSSEEVEDKRCRYLGEAWSRQKKRQVQTP